MANEINATTVNAAAVASVESSDAAQAQPVATPLTEGTEKEFSVQVMRVQLFDNEDIVNVQLRLNKAIPGFTKTEDGDFVAADVDAVSLFRSTITKQLCDVDESIALLRDGQKTAFTRAQIVTILHGASLVIKRTYHVAGYVRENGEAIDRDQWFTDIKSCKLTEFAKQLVQQVVIQRMMSENQ